MPPIKTHLKASFLIILFILNNVVCVYSQNQDTLSSLKSLERYPALLWEITSPENAHVSYIYGALKTSEKLAFHLIDSFFIVLNASTRIVLEMHPDSTAKALQDPEILKRVYKNYYNTSYHPSGNYYNLLSTSTFDPELLEVILAGGYTRLNTNNEMEEEKSLIDFVYTTALKTNKQVAGLIHYTEYIDQSEKTEKFVKEANKKKKNIREDYQEQYLLYQKALDAYRKGDLGELDTLVKKIVNMPEYYSAILDPYYSNLASRMVKHIEETACFIMADATVMGGKNGIIEQLRQNGFELKPVSHYILTKPNKQKEKMERMTAKVKTEVYIPPSGAWSVKVPSHTIGAAAQHAGQSMFFDRLNDVLYSVNRYPTFANLTFQNPDYIFQRLDSVLYEYIPGKMIKREDHIISGFPAVDLTNKTSRGNLEQSRIIITPLEIIIFKVSGKKNYIKKGRLGNKFIASAILSNQKGSGWQEVTTGHGEFKLTLPPYHIVDSTTNVVFVGTNIIYQAWDPETSTYYLFRRNIHHDLNLLEEDTFDLNYMSETMAEKMKMKIEKESPDHHQGFPSLKFTLKEKDGEKILHSKIVMRGAVHYLLMTTANDEALVNKYFDGFLIKPFEYALKGDTLTDTVLLFSVVSSIGKQEKDDNTGTDEYWMEEEEESEAEKNKKLEFAYQAVEDKATFYFDLGAEYIAVNRRKENDFVGFNYYKDLFNNLKKRENPSNDYVILKEIMDSSYVFPYLDITLSDTSTTRQIHKKIIIHHGLIYTLTTMNNILEKENPFTGQFFHTFTPFKDTLTGRSLTEDKGLFWIRSFLSEDTIQVKQAIRAIDNIKFYDHHKDSLFHIIQRKDLIMRNIAVSTSLIERYGKLKGDDIPTHLMELYDDYSDHPDIQISIFRALAFHEGKKARKMMLQILKTDIPLPSSVYEINSLVEPLIKLDSQLVALYPEIMNYERYPEYSKWVLAISATLAEKGLIKPDQHPEVVKMIRDRVDEEIKRRRVMDIVDKASKDKSEEIFNTFYDYSDMDDEFTDEEMDDDLVLFDQDSYLATDEYDEDDERVKENEKNSLSIMDYSKFFLMVKFLSQSQQQQKTLPLVYYRILEGKNRTDALALAVLLVENGTPVHDSIWHNFAKNPKSRVDLYRRLKAIGRTDLFDTVWLHQQSFTEGFLHIRGKIYETDSLSFITRRWVQTPKKSGFVYFYKYKSGYGSKKDWYLNVVGIQPADTNAISEVPDFIRFEIEQIYFNDNLEEIIDKQMKEFRKMHRKRFNRDDYYDDDMKDAPYFNF